MKHASRLAFFLTALSGAVLFGCAGDKDTTTDTDTTSPTGDTGTETVPECGDGEINGDDVCDGTDLGDATCKSEGFGGGVLACDADCTGYDTTGCTAVDPCGNGVLDAGEDCDGAELGTGVCSDFDTLVDGTLGCNSDCTYDTTPCVSASDWIGAVRVEPDSKKLSMPIAKAWVTYVKPALGGDPAGFFIQAEQTGPGLFVGIEATTLDKGLAVGDEVSFDVTQLSTLFGDLRSVSAVGNFSIDSTGNDVTTLIQDLSSEATLSTAIGDFDSELASIDMTVAADFFGAGAPAVAADVATPGIPVSKGDVRLRMDEAIQDSLDLTFGCSLNVTAPLWRFFTTAQPSAWDTSDVTVATCPAPTVLEALALDPTTVVVIFDRRLDPKSVDLGDFAFDNGLKAIGVVVGDRDVTITTSKQVGLQEYTLTVTGVTDTLGELVDPAANVAAFVGFDASEADCADGIDNNNDGEVDCFDATCVDDAECLFPADLLLWEVDADQTGTDDAEFVEIWNNRATTVDFATEGWFIVMVNGSDDLVDDAYQLTGTLAAGETHVVGSKLVANVDQIEWVTNGIQNGADGIILVRCDACTDAATDFPDDVDPTGVGTFTTDDGNTATKVDALAYDTNDGDDKGLIAALGVAAQFNEGGGAAGSATEANQRTSLGGWTPLVPAPGAF
ncbi:MAG: hypothetical protein KTR31_15100 [Myxococcales bacterium]|nr:hypothetical protein [Myxococcales bacterium]